jgi:DUF438 domain-containing protein
MESKKELLKPLILKLHEGTPLDEVKKEFIANFSDVSASEIAEIEQKLIEDGLPETEVKRLCDVHVEVFKHSLDKQEKPIVPSGHPVHNLMAENRATENILQNIESIIQQIGKPPNEKELKLRVDQLQNLVTNLSDIDKHYLKKENQLFPRLEEKGKSGPSQVMWAIHDDIRGLIKQASSKVSMNDSQVLEL